MHPPATYTIKRIPLLPTPRGQEETSRRGILLTVECS
jgi:hypothetical protein